MTTALYDRVRALWGDEAVLRMVQEECGELIVAVNHRLRERIVNEVLAEELADVIIVAEQAARIVGADLVEEAKRRKLHRLAMRVRIAEAKEAAR